MESVASVPLALEDLEIPPEILSSAPTFVYSSLRLNIWWSAHSRCNFCKRSNSSSSAMPTVGDILTAAIMMFISTSIPLRNQRSAFIINSPLYNKLDHDAAWTSGGGGPPTWLPGSVPPALPACIPPAIVKRQGVIRRHWTSKVPLSQPRYIESVLKNSA